MSSGRGKGPIGGVIGMLGTGVGAVAEYREYRKERKLTRESSDQGKTIDAGPSDTQSHPVSDTGTAPTDLPPAYSDVAGEGSRRSPASENPALQDKKALLAQYGSDQSHSSDDNDLSSVEDDEEQWELDELIDKDSSTPPSYEQSEELYGNTDELVGAVMDQQAHFASSPQQQQFVRTPIPAPVVVPQRRPRNKTRGFVRAYAPVLGECSGIDQETFLGFLENFDKSSQASPIFGIIELSAAIAGFAPEPTVMAVAAAVEVAARVGGELQTRYRTNDFLNKMNEQLFKPAGLYAMIVKYKSDAEVQASGDSMLTRFGVSAGAVNFNTNQTIAKYNRTSSDESTAGRGMSERFQNLRLASGTTKGAVNLPSAAPLIFPDVDKAIATQGTETFKDKAKDAQGFLAGYMDRRAHVKYARNDPTSNLVLPELERTFRSKLADPDHPMYNSGPIGFLSGGHLARNRDDTTCRQGKRERKQERRIQKYERRMDSGRDLSRKKQRRYDDYLASEEAYGRNGSYDSSDRLGYDPIRRNEGRQRRGGPIGLVGGLVGGAIGAATGSGGRSREYEDSYNRPAPQAEYGRRSFNDRKGAYAQTQTSPRIATEPAEYASHVDRASNSRERYRGPRKNQRRGGGPIGMVRRALQEDVLYLMIVNMPSEAEMAEAREKMQRAKSGR